MGDIFIHSSVDGRLDCCHILAIVNNATVNIEVHVSFQMSVFIFSGCLPRSGIAGSYGSSLISFFFQGISILFSTVILPLHSHQQCTGTLFLHILTSICYLWSFLKQAIWQVWGDISLCFLLAFICDIEYHMYLLAIYPYVFFGKISIQIFCLFYNFFFFLY